MPKKAHMPPLAATRAIRKIGEDLRIARLRRRLPLDVICQRAFLSRSTLTKVFKGDASVSIGAYGAVMHALNLLDRLPEVAADDRLGMMLEVEQLPQRIRRTRRRD